MTDEKFPYAGADVWFVFAPGQVWPAKVVANGTAQTPAGEVPICALIVFMLNGVSFQQAPQDELGKMPGTWHWPKPTKVQIAQTVPAGFDGKPRI